MPKDLFDETSEGLEGRETIVEVPVVEGKTEQEVIEPTPKTYSEKEYKSVKAEAARRRIENKQLMERLDALEQQGRQYSQPQRYQQYQQGYYPPNQPGYIPPQQYPQQPGIVYDPRVDDMQLDKILAEIEGSDYIKDNWNEVDEEGRTFQDRLLDEANAKGYGFDQLPTLARAMVKWEEVISKQRQSGIDEAYQSMKKKETSAPDKPASSGQVTSEGEPESYDDAIRSVIKEHGIPE
jgi:hypothetical protein